MTHYLSRQAGTTALPMLGLLTALLGAPLPSHAQAQAQAPSRGELLYTTHCSECHSSQMHWREKKKVNDWPSLRAQVTFWQAQAQLGWGDEDITSVARYLNATFYRLPPPADAKTAGALPVGSSLRPRRIYNVDTSLEIESWKLSFGSGATARP